MASSTIQSITIEGFKSIRSIKDFPLRPVNVLIGANGSGKSNFLEAFVFLSEVIHGRIDAYVIENGGADKLLYFGSKETDSILIGWNDESGRTYFAGGQSQPGDALRGTAAFSGFGKIVPSWQRYQFHGTGRNSPIKKTSQLDDNRFLRPDGSNLAAFLHFLQQKHGESYAAIRRTLQQVAPFFEDFQLEPLKLNPNTLKLDWRHFGTDAGFDGSALSDGTLRFVALATLFLQPAELRPSVILVDEPELGLHPQAIGLLAPLIRQASKESQVIAATQSSLLLDHFEPEDILVANRVDGATTIERLNSEPLADWLKEYSLGQLWEKGELAGGPVKE
jgi:predicted ATPase